MQNRIESASGQIHVVTVLSRFCAPTQLAYINMMTTAGIYVYLSYVYHRAWQVTEAVYLKLVAMSLVQVLLGRGQLSLGVLQIPSHGLHLVSGAFLMSRLCTSQAQISPPNLPQHQSYTKWMESDDLLGKE